MFAVFVWTLISLRHFFHSASAALFAPHDENAPWFMGCASAQRSGSLGAPSGAAHLDPVSCSLRCLDEGFQVAAVTSEGCYCGSWQPGLEFAECLSTPSTEGTQEVGGGSRGQSDPSLPVGDGRRTVALYRTKGPFLHSVLLSVSPHSVQAGETFALEISGNLAGRPDQLTGILSLGRKNFSYVTVEIWERTQKGQSSHRAKVLRDGSFVVRSDWILEAAGKYEFNVCVSNPLSTHSCTLQLSVLQPSSHSPLISVFFASLRVPRRIHFLRADNADNVIMEVACLHHAVTPHMHKVGGQTVVFSLSFPSEEDGTDSRDVKNVFLQIPDGWNGTLVVFNLTIPEVRVTASGCQPTSEEGTPVDAELFPSIKHLPGLCITVNTENRTRGSKSDGSVSDINDQDPSSKIHKKSVNPECHCGATWDSHGTHILVQQPVLLVLDVPAGLNVTASPPVNATLLQRSGSDTAGEVVVLLGHTGMAVVRNRAENQVSSPNKSLMSCEKGKGETSPQVGANLTWQPPAGQGPVHSAADNVQIYAAKQAYPTNTDVTFLAVAEETPAEFLWHFGDSSSSRTTSRSITKRYNKPGRYDVVVVMFRGRTSFTSDVFPLLLQRAVKLNRLLHQPSVLLNQTVTLSCRVTAGTDVSFLWSFGDGPSRPGNSTEYHTFHKTGEFRVTVMASNLVSSASLSSHIFVVDQPCQPPPVKNMGPLTLQVRRYEVIHLGVTYENEVDCDSEDLGYTWTLFDSAGQVFPLPLIDVHKQTLILPSHLLDYDTYTATARVQVIGSVVYSNYTVRVQIMPSSPVAFIQGGTNIFINSQNTTLVSLDGRQSYDPDFPKTPLSFTWTCEPVSTITSSCFHRDPPTSSSVLLFPASLLRNSFDQFRFTLTVCSGERSASSETFLTLTSNAIRKVSVHCPECQGDQLNWDQPLTVSALCQACEVAPKYIQYTWSLYLVDASSKPVIEVPFCYTMDLSTPSAVMGTVSSRTQTVSTHPTNVTDSLQYTAASKTSAFVSLIEDVFETAVKPRDVADGRNETGEDPFYHSPGAFDPPEPLYASTEYQPLALDNSGVVFSDHFGDVISGFPEASGSSADWEFSFAVSENVDSGGGPDFDYVPLMKPEEGDPGLSAGRPTGVDGKSQSAGDDSGLHLDLHEDSGSNLVDSRPSVLVQAPVLLDLSRDLVDRALFESYTYTGISSPSLSFRPFSLRPGNRYMLEVTAKYRDSLLGRTQLFLKTNPAPKGMLCQVQPAIGMELYTHFSIFCTSGREDLTYKYSICVGDGAPRILYQGRDFQYYFSLPHGDPNDDFKVTIYTEIRSSMYGTATRPCPVTVQVQPSFLRDASTTHLDPDLELSVAALRNLSTLLQLGNNAEVRNYVSLLSGILNRLSLDPRANAHALTYTRNALINTMCGLESREQALLVDSINILTKLLQITNQVTLASARKVTLHVQSISEKFWKPPLWYTLDQKTLGALVVLLSHSLQAAISSSDFPAQTTNRDVNQQAFKLDSGGDTIRNTTTLSNRPPSKGGRSVLLRQTMQLVTDTLATSSDLTLKYVLFHEAWEHRVSAGFVSLYAAYQNQTFTTVASSSAAFSIPASLIRLLLARHRRGAGGGLHQPCVLTMITELARSPYPWACRPWMPSGPVVDLSLHECSTRRKIPVRSLIHPINVELQRPPQNSSASEYVLRRSQVNYHSFNITQQHLQHAIQLSVEFKRPLRKPFPIMLLFRMFERPTPSMHHLRRTHNWRSTTARFTLPSSYITATGVAYVALLNADFEKAPKRNHASEQVSYSFTVDGSLCVSWNGHQGAWTDGSCRTRQADASAAVSCSCHQLEPLSVAQLQLQSSLDTADLDRFLSVSSNWTVLVVLVLCVCLYIPGWVACRRADISSEENRRVHYLSDNCPHDSFLYAVKIHTGLRSAACMSAKVYMVLKGEDGVSQTRELRVPGCTLFKRHSQDTFLISTAESLGPVWGVHIWHDNSGPSPEWYLTQVEVFEVSSRRGEGRAWLFVAQCWLAATGEDGQVERVLRVCTEGIGFAQMLRLKLLDYLSDHHVWMSVFSCPCPHSFTHTQRLGVSLLLLLGYAGANAAIVSQTDHPLPFELGIIDVSAVSVTNGVLSVLAVLPAAAMASFLFRLPEMKLKGSGDDPAKEGKGEKSFCKDAHSLTDRTSEPRLSWFSPPQRAQAAWSKNSQDTDLPPAFTSPMDNKDTHREPVIQNDGVVTKEQCPAVKNSMEPSLQDIVLISDADQETVKGNSNGCHTTDRLRESRLVFLWCHHLAWGLCLLLCFSCLVFAAVLATRFSSSKALLWAHSLFFSLASCIFLIQPAMIITVAVAVSFWHRKRADFCISSSKRGFQAATSQHWRHGGSDPDRCSYLEKLLRARQRARYLRLVRPPTPEELRKICGKRRREALLRKTFRDLLVCGSMLLLMLCINHSISFSDHYHLNKAITKGLVRGHNNTFLSIKNHEDWWKWAQTSLLHFLYKDASLAPQPHVLIGEPILQKMEACGFKVSSLNLIQESLDSFRSGSRATAHLDSSQRSGSTVGPSATMRLGHTESDAASILKLLHSGGWLGRQTVALKVQFTLFSPAPNLFTSVTMLAEQNPTGVLLPSAKVQSVRVYHSPATWDYIVMVCQLLYLLISLLHLWDQMHSVWQRGFMRYWSTPRNWLEVSLLTVTLVHYIYYIYHSALVLEVVEQLLQKRNQQGHVDVSLLAAWEQDIRTLRGVILFVLIKKLVTTLRSGTAAACATHFTRTLSDLFWPTILGLIVMVALSSMGNLLFSQSSKSFASFSSSFKTLLYHHWGLRAARHLHSSWSNFFHRALLYLPFTVVLTAVVICVVSSLVRSARRSQSRGNIFTIAQIFAYIRQSVSGFGGKHSKPGVDNAVKEKTYYFEEFEGLLDELLFRLSTLSNSLHHTLPTKAHPYRENSPVISPVPSNMDTQDFVKTHLIEDTMMTDLADISHGLPASYLLQSKPELEISDFRQPGAQRGDRSSSALNVALDNTSHKTGTEENAKDTGPQSDLNEALSHLDSAPLIRVWTEDIIENQAAEETKTNYKCFLGKSQATHKEVVVEVLVHTELGSAETN